MKKFIILFTCSIFTAPLCFGGVFAATCSKLSLTKCLDSACALNIGTNPAARCQQCGTSNAGISPTESGMQQLSLGASAKTSITDKELEQAPSDPGKRYKWATELCIKKIPNCNGEDVTDTYDKLIEQSCTAAGINMQMSELQKSALKTKSSDACTSEIKLCLTGEKKCNSDYSNCANDSDFNNFFAVCAADANKCDEYITFVKSTLVSARNGAIKTTEDLISRTVNTYQNARNKKLQTAKDICNNNNGRDKCIKTVCANNMENKCKIGFESEKSMAMLLCKFYEKACENINKK